MAKTCQLAGEGQASNFEVTGGRKSQRENVSGLCNRSSCASPMRGCRLGTCSTLPYRVLNAWLCLWLGWLWAVSSDLAAPADAQAERLRLRATAKEMFYHGYDNYMRYAFPHDELAPLTKGWADSLAELGDAPRNPNSEYNGVALTLIDALDMLGIVGNRTEFSSGVDWVCRNVSFDQDVRVNLFELNIRVLGGLLSAHYLAMDKELALMDEYNGCLLGVALEVGERMLPAFDTPTAIPYPWINLAKGVVQGDSRTQCVAGAGTLLLEFGTLSRLSGNSTYHDVAIQALQSLWSRRSAIGLLGNTLDMGSGSWTNENAGIGGGVDSFYEYILKSYVVFEDLGDELWDMWQESYAAVRKHLKQGPWYVQSHMRTGRVVHKQFESLQAFWPALQVLAGDIGEAVQTHEAMFRLWQCAPVQCCAACLCCQWLQAVSSHRRCCVRGACVRHATLRCADEAGSMAFCPRAFYSHLTLYTPQWRITLCDRSWRNRRMSCIGTPWPPCILNCNAAH